MLGDRHSPNGLGFKGSIKQVSGPYQYAPGASLGRRGVFVQRRAGRRVVRMVSSAMYWLGSVVGEWALVRETPTAHCTGGKSLEPLANA